MTETLDIKLHILKTAINLLEEGYSQKELTVRKIANEAHIAVGLINYHFGSKDNLLVEAVNLIIFNSSKVEMNNLFDKTIDPKMRLQMFLENISELVLHYKVYSKIILNHEFFSDNFDTPRYIEEILKEIEPLASENEIKWLAIQIVAPLQYIFLKEDGFYTYMKQDEVDFLQLIKLQLKRLGLDHE